MIICGPTLPAAEIRVAGLLPSGVSGVHMALDDGSEIPVAGEDGTYAVQFARSGAMPVSISWWVGGAEGRAPVSVPARSGSEDCELTQWTAVVRGAVRPAPRWGRVLIARTSGEAVAPLRLSAWIPDRKSKTSLGDLPTYVVNS